jgi:hypothetical protein
VQVLRQTAEVAETRSEAAEGDGELGRGEVRDQGGHRATGQFGDLGEVRSVEDDAQVDGRGGGTAGRRHRFQPAQHRDVDVRRRAAEHHEDRPSRRDQLALAGQRAALERGPDGSDRGQVGDLHEQRPVAVGQHPVHDARCRALLHAVHDRRRRGGPRPQCPDAARDGGETRSSAVTDALVR